MATQDKVSAKADSALIQKLFNIKPISWARYPDGTLSFISPTGQKFVYTDQALQEFEADLKAKAAAAKKAAAPAKSKSSSAARSSAAKKK